jgi:polysaccharide deacetylase family protein (PEP-CTERM system associated)
MTPTPSAPALLFSIDLEEFYPAEPDRDPRSSPLEGLVKLYLDLLERHQTRATFFVVGEVARKFPGLLRAIAAAGHELGCHGDRHLTLDQFNPETFAADLRANRAAVESAAGIRVQGFRAPLLSLTARCAWAHAVLAREGFTYSSSVLPAANPLFGWPDFGAVPRRQDGVWEIPVTVSKFFGLGPLPLFSGTYFRVLPWWLVRQRLPAPRSPLPLISYFHPYDIDRDQPWTMHAGVRGSLPMNALLFFRRRSLPGRIAGLLRTCPRGNTYSEYIKRHP